MGAVAQFFAWLGIGGGIAVGRLAIDAARGAGLVATPFFGNPVAAPGNHPDEDHVLWQIPISFRRWRLPETRDDFSVYLHWHFSDRPGPYQMALCGGRRPLAQSALRPTLGLVVPIAIRSTIGERVRLATQPDLLVDAPRDVARLLDLGVLWEMASPRIDFPPGTNWITLELRRGTTMIASAPFRLNVPNTSDDNARFELFAAPGTVLGLTA